MTDDKFDLSRRKLLGAFGAMGTGAALGGAGTMAYFNDKEKSTGNTFTAGELDLEIDWVEHYNGEKIEDQDLTSNPGPIFDLGDVKPGDYGEATISLHVFDNPAFVHMAGELTSNAENGVNEPESKAEEEDDPKGPDSGDDWSGELADEILVDVWYDGTEEDPDGGNNVFDEGELPIASGTLRDVMAQLEDGRLLRDQTSDGDGGGGGNGGECLTSDEWKIDKTPAVGDTAGPNGEVEITAVEREAGEVVGVEWESSTDICLVAVKGGPSTATYEYDCATSGGIDYAPKNTGNENRTYYEISNVQFYCCEDGDGGNGDGDDCWPNSTTQYIGFSWELPKEVGNEVQSDSVSFDLKFHAQQCRHKDEPRNPFDGNA
ncbi:TasA family protein [Halomicrococcus sp. SG-WS-1]|uniref:TasA family protein n=1 Tax=Halomicrococcus sp. SG-WS-1 TaxID=3439057 RepID=UPI003F78B479